MTPFIYNHTQNLFKAENHDGFYCFNEFTILNDNLTTITSADILEKIFKSHFFADKFIAPIGRKIKTSLNEHGSLLIDKLTTEDYCLINLDGLKEKIRIYGMDENWGDDLITFKSLFLNSIDLIKKNGLDRNPIYYLNQEDIDDSKLLDFNYFSYFISLIIISLEKNKIILIDYGGD